MAESASVADLQSGRRVRRSYQVRWATDSDALAITAFFGPDRPITARFRRGDRCLLATLRDEGATLLAYPGLGLLYALVPEASNDAAVAQRLARRAAEVARAAGGSAVLEQASVDARSGLDVFGNDAGLLPLHRALKSRFDPAGVLNPGRFLGRL